MRIHFFVSLIVALFTVVICSNARAGTTVEDLRKEVADLRKRINEKDTAAPIRKVESVIENKYDSPCPVITKNGKLEIGGLLQIWNYHIENDNQDVFSDTGAFAGTGGTGEAIDNNSYRVRRAEIRMTMDIHENVTAVVMIDPAREATSFPGISSNQGLFKSQRENPWIARDDLASVARSSVGRVQTGSGAAPRLLQDAYINFHGIVPHHDFTIGQFKPPFGEEGPRNSAYLDFAERAMVTQMNDYRDLGATVHGAWWDNRLQYWLGALDSAGNFFGTAGNQTMAALGVFETANRSDDNDQKDFIGSILVRPLWKHGCWGSMELGYSGQFGRHGSSGDLTDDGSGPINGMNRLSTSAIRHAAWAMYKPMGPVRGWWLRGEYGFQKDRTAPLTVNAFDLGGGPNGEQAAPRPFSREGFYVSTGYKLKDSIFAERLGRGGFWNNLLEPVEFAARYERFGNIITEDLVQPNLYTDVFATQAMTLGINYYLQAYKMRLQVNYMIVDEPERRQADRVLRECRNNVFIATYQVSF
ncbi:MAG: porin [Planctomycetota bacterium]